jgi:AraC family transcriptional regulator
MGAQWRPSTLLHLRSATMPGSPPIQATQDAARTEAPGAAAADPAPEPLMAPARPGPGGEPTAGTAKTASNQVTGNLAHRMNRVFDYIERHLSDDLSLERLSAVAAFSRFHFHRLFRAWTGETLKDFVRRRRLEAAGMHLRFEPHDSITQVAQGVGFESPAAFTRAFRLHFGMTPSAWRFGGHALWESRLATSTPPSLTRYDVEVRYQPAMQVLYWRAQGDYSQTVAALWARFVPWTQALGLEGQTRLGMGLDDPAVTPASRCRFDACVVLPPDWRDPGLRVSRREVPAGWVAALAYDGPDTGIGKAWHQMLIDWLPNQAFTLADRPFFERYPADQPLPSQGRVRCELCMPVQRSHT